jgi:hypothetical protein
MNATDQVCFVCKQVFDFNDLNLCMTCGEGFCDGCARVLAGCDCLVAELLDSMQGD